MDMGGVAVVSVGVGGGGVAFAAGTDLRHQRVRVVKRAYMAGRQAGKDHLRLCYIDSESTIKPPVFVLLLGVRTRP